MDIFSDDTLGTASPQLRHQRRWFQFSLRTLLIVLTIFAVGMGWLMQQVNVRREAVKREQVVLAEIKKIGTAYADFSIAVRYAIESRPILTSFVSWPRGIFGEEEYRLIESIDMGDSRIMDEGLEHLSKLTTLQELEANDTQITDAGVVHLKKLTALKRLYLNNTQITDVGLQHLSQLKALKCVSLFNTQITDAGYAKLKAELPNCVIDWSPPEKAKSDVK